MKRPRDLADRSRDLRILKDDGFLRETFTLPLHVARLEARQILDEYPASGYMTIVEKWRQLPKRPDRIHDTAVADGGLGKSPCVSASPSRLVGSDVAGTFFRSAKPNEPNTKKRAPTTISQ
jgi:hypothetical protein